MEYLIWRIWGRRSVRAERALPLSLMDPVVRAPQTRLARIQISPRLQDYMVEWGDLPLTHDTASARGISPPVPFACGTDPLKEVRRMVKERGEEAQKKLTCNIVFLPSQHNFWSTVVPR